MNVSRRGFSGLLINLGLSAGLGFGSLALAAEPAAEPAFEEGIDYSTIELVAEIKPGEDVKVQEFFYYGCPHCYSMEPLVHAWEKSLPKGVSFERVPTPFNDPKGHWPLHARAFYTANQLGVSPAAHGALFEAIHKDKKDLFDRESLAKFYAGHGVDKDKFLKRLGSFGIDSKLRKAKLGLLRYKIDGVPSFIVNGRYKTSPSMVGSNQKAMDVVKFLVAKELAAQK